MGMAASQARFLSLTARKSNVEYEGQQVNQQRTALANESANLYNKLSSITVPTPPSTSDYYETVYTFTTSELDTTSQSGSTEYTLNNIYSNPDGMYASLSYTAYQWQSAVSSAYSGSVNTSYDETTGKNKYSVSLANGSVQDAVKYEYKPSSVDLSLDLSSGSVEIAGNTFTLNNDNSTITDGNVTYNVTENSDGTYTLTLAVEQEAEGENYTVDVDGAKFNVIYDASTGTYSCELANSTVNGRYVDENGNATSATNYFTPEFLSSGGLANQPILGYNVGSTTYYISAAETQKGEFSSSSYVQSVGHTEYVDYPCSYSTAASGRYQTLTITDDYGNTHEFSLDVQTVQDEDAYDQAMLDYEYDQARYEKEVADLNAKTESLQQQDRTLELRLKQLDTEQNAIATEMDAVSKVIEDNIEATFKTFA